MEHCKGMEGLAAEAIKHTIEEPPEKGPTLDLRRAVEPAEGVGWRLTAGHLASLQRRLAMRVHLG